MPATVVFFLSTGEALCLGRRAYLLWRLGICLAQARPPGHPIPYACCQRCYLADGAQAKDASKQARSASLSTQAEEKARAHM